MPKKCVEQASMDIDYKSKNYRYEARFSIYEMNKVKAFTTTLTYCNQTM